MEAGGIEFRVPLFRKYCNDNHLDHKYRRVQRLRIDYTRLLLTVGAVCRLHLLGTIWAHLGRREKAVGGGRNYPRPSWPRFGPQARLCTSAAPFDNDRCPAAGRAFLLAAA